MTGEWPKRLLDHHNGDKHDNSWQNLREATHSQNMANSVDAVRKVQKLPRGVIERSKSPPTFIALITANGKREVIGIFRNAFEAGEAYRQRAIEVHGEFAYDGPLVLETADSPEFA